MIQQCFSREKKPCLWRAIPVIEELLMALEAKAMPLRFIDYHDVIEDGIDKLKKYYSQFDFKLSIVLLVMFRFFLSLFLRLTYSIQYFIHTSSWHTLNRTGAVQGNRHSQ